jgi:hypothetical protein
MENICANKNIKFYNYVLNIHNFDSKPACDFSVNLEEPKNLWVDEKLKCNPMLLENE